ncbi:MAG: DUF1127 domain-containing protein [Gemmobacter sp.]|jgi:uncharacterized protein YjiS (DUF1127 family)|nr:DUF1127 domain-containing protein [Gemmobacter sp.]
MFASLHTSALTLRRVERRGGTGLMSRVLAAIALSAQRRRLADLDDARLDDLGLTRAQARSEAARAPWDVPANWLA